MSIFSVVHGRSASKGWKESKLGEQDLDGGGVVLDVQGLSADLGFVFWPLCFCLPFSVTLPSTCPHKSLCPSAVSAH